MARVPGRPHQHRARAGHAGRRHRPDPREDVREPPVLRGQARLHGRSGDRSATRTARSSAARAGFTASAWRARTSAPAWRCSSRRCAPRARRRSATSARSTAATSASTSGCAGLGARIERVATERRVDGLTARRSRRHDPPDPSGHPGRAARRDARAARDQRRACAQSFEGAGYGEVRTPALEYEDVLRRGEEHAAGARYRTFDEQGDVLALRSDMTIPIARVVATRYADAGRRCASATSPTPSAPSSAARASRASSSRAGSS